MHSTLSKNPTDRKKIMVSGRCRIAKKFFVFAIVTLTSRVVLAQTSKVIEANQASNEGLVIIPFSNALERNFRPLHPYSPKGPELHTLEGDPSNGPSLTIFRYGKNYAGSGNLHNHTHGYRLWLIEGKMKHWDTNGSEETAKILLPGSYIYQPADEFHAANCLSERCTAYVMFDGPIKTGFPVNKGMESEENNK